MRFSTSLPVLASCLAGFSSALQAADWKQLSIYQVLTDRYATTHGTSPSCFIRNYCGGTWRGIINKLDYIQGMGFDAIWISPIVHQIEQNTTYGQAFHGYWANNPYTLNPHFGTSDDLKALSAALHKRGMYLMVDVVINHLCSNKPAGQVNYAGEFPAPFNTADAFHYETYIDYSNQTSIEYGWLVDYGDPILPDVKTEDPTVLDAMISSVVNNVKNYSIDGIRFDTARHIQPQYVGQLQQAVGVFITGEVANDSIPYNAFWQSPNIMQSVLNYPLFYVMPDVFLGRTTFQILASNMLAEQAVFQDSLALGSFLDNHDQPRFASRFADDPTRDMNAATFLFFGTGIPIIYYGFEQRFNGGYDPINREPLWTSNYNTEAPLYIFIAKLNKIRHGISAAFGKTTFFNSNPNPIIASAEYMAFSKGPLLIVVNNLGQNPATNPQEPDGAARVLPHNFAIPSSGFGSGSTIVDLLSCQSVTVGGGGSFTSAARLSMPRIWAPASMASPFCPS